MKRADRERLERLCDDHVCLKCGHRGAGYDEFRATGGGFSKIVDVQNKKFLTISCDRCGYTELFKSNTTTLGNVFDFLTNG